MMVAIFRFSLVFPPHVHVVQVDVIKLLNIIVFYNSIDAYSMSIIATPVMPNTYVLTLSYCSSIMYGN